MGVSGRGSWSTIGLWAGFGRAANTRFASVYRLGGVLGSGGTGIVHEAYRSNGGSESVCALKIFCDAVSLRPEAASMALRQVASLRSAGAPGFVEIRDVGVFQGRLFVEMELLRGAPLSASLLLNDMPMSMRRAILRDVLRCLAHIHAHGGVHGDLKPGNVFLTDAGGVKVIDFGWPNAFPSDSAAAMTACVTPAYATPDRLAGVPLSASDDVYAAACIIHFVLTGLHPFCGLSGAEASVSGLRPPSLRTLLHPQSCEAVEKALSFDRRKRFADMADFIAELGDEFGT